MSSGEDRDREVSSDAVPVPRPEPPCEHPTPGTSGSVAVHPAASDRPTPVPHTGVAWLMRHVTHVPGVLRLDGERLRFVSTSRVVFDATPAELGLEVARARRGTFRVTADGERLVLSVVRPSGAVAVPADLVDREGGAAPTRGDHAAAAAWRMLLAPMTQGDRAGARPLPTG